MKFGKRLKVILENRGISAYRLGQLSGVPPQRITPILAGKQRYPSFSNFLKMAKGLGMSPWGLLQRIYKEGRNP